MSGGWVSGVSDGGWCVTDTGGRCVIAKTGVKDSIGAITLSISDALATEATDDPAANHDPDGDSDGTTISVARP